MGTRSIYQAYQGTGEVQRACQVLESCRGSPILLEAGPHAGCGRLRQLLAVQALLLWPRPVRQYVEGSR